MKLTKIELTAMAEQMCKRLNTEASIVYAAQIELFEKPLEGRRNLFIEEVKVLEEHGKKFGVNVWYSTVDMPGAPKKVWFDEHDIFNRLVIKQIDLKDVQHLVNFVEGDLRKKF